MQDAGSNFELGWPHATSASYCPSPDDETRVQRHGGAADVGGGAGLKAKTGIAGCRRRRRYDVPLVDDAGHVRRHRRPCALGGVAGAARGRCGERPRTRLMAWWRRPRGRPTA